MVFLGETDGHADCHSSTGLTKATDPEEESQPEYIFQLPDGVQSRFRYNWSSGSPVAEFRIPNRTVKACAARVAAAFAQPHAVLELTDAARGSFVGYQTCLNVQANAAAKALWLKQIIQVGQLNRCL